jgi:hypothetical protein
MRHSLLGACAIGMTCLLLCGTVGIVGCKIRTERGRPEAPTRPSGVPDQAIWSGGAEGGVFLIVRPFGPSEPNVYTGAIYNEYSGDVVYQGRLLLKPANGAPIPVADPESYSGWDGDTLYLSDGRQLKVPTPP